MQLKANDSIVEPQHRLLPLSVPHTLRFKASELIYLTSSVLTVGNACSCRMLRLSAARCTQCVRQHFIRAASTTAAGGDSHNVQHLRAVLDDVASGKLSVQDAAGQLEPHVTSGVENIAQFAKIDHLRAARTGISEVIFGEAKSSQQIRNILQAMIR
eukprot:7445-Heterococcus_DN1.PRE.2